MLGWNISVHRFGEPRLRAHRGHLESMLTAVRTHLGVSELPKTEDADPRLAVWQTGIGGIDWLEELVEAGKAAHNRRGGYPESYVIRCGDFRDRLAAGLPDERPQWVSGSHDVLTERWLGKTTLDAQELERCDPHEWLLVEAWDES